MGIQAQVRKTHVKSERQARALGFVSSPTLRVNGRDIAGELRESCCGSCSSACGDGTPVNCRVWSYQGQQHAQAPVGLIVESILQEVIGTPKRPELITRESRAVPSNLKRYFARKTPLCKTSTVRRGLMSNQPRSMFHVDRFFS